MGDLMSAPMSSLIKSAMGTRNYLTHQFPCKSRAFHPDLA